MRSLTIIKNLDSLESVDADAWNSLTDGSNPFLQYDYLQGLERYGCLDGHGWTPCHLLAYHGEVLAGAVPLYLKTNSYGEFVFDWAWADAYERAGGRYYPKLVSAIPFAPVIGPRILVRRDLPIADETGRLLAAQSLALAEDAGLSSCHYLFTEPEDQLLLTELRLLQRTTCQFHWFNNDFRDFQDFLDSLTSKKRKQIKRERKQVADSGIEIEILCGGDITENHWQVFYEFYCSTFHRRWGSPRLTLEFFRSLGILMPSNTMLILAKTPGAYVAGAFVMRGGDTLFGRHWGCSSQFPFLHFELCYYQTIEYCIANKLHKVDAGVQGEHKLSRGFRPVGAISCHWIRHPEFRAAIQNYLERETLEMNYYLESLGERLPFKSELSVEVQS